MNPIRRIKESLVMLLVVFAALAVLILFNNIT